MRKLSLVIAGILGAGGPLISQAATLGEAQVQSYLSEPLEVRVPLMRSSDEPLDEITVQLAPPSFYRDAGVSLAKLTGNLTFAIESERGQEYVRIGSKRPIRDPIMSILLQVQSPQGRMIRSYNLLLDPPSTASASAESSARETISRQEPRGAASTPSRSTSWQRVEPATDLDLDSTRKVQRGDTLSAIASDFVAEGQDIRPVMQAIIDANPQAFVNGNGNSLMAGAELKVPSAPATSDQPSEGSAAESGQQRPALELLSPQAQGQDERTTLGGFGELSRENPLPAVAEAGSQASTASAPDDAETALNQEELESVKAENEALTEQLQSLKEQIDSVKVAVDDRDGRIAELKEAVEESRQQVEEARANQDNFWVQWGKYLVGAMGLLVLALLIALGLRRARKDEEPAVAMPATADINAAPRPDKGEATWSSTASASAGGAAVGAFAASAQDDTATADFASAESDLDDPMNPEMVLEEARVLESFNLTHQALELVQESLEEHPGHEGLQAAVNRLKGVEEGAPASESADEPASPAMVDDVTAGDEAAGDSVAWEGEPEYQEESATEWQADTDTEEESQAPAQAAGEISWDDDFDDMLATPETESSPEVDDNVMEFDDSFALETPAEDTSADEPESSEESLTESEPSSQAEGEASSSQGDLDALDLDLDGYEPQPEASESVSTEEDSGLELDMSPEPEEEPVAESSTEDAVSTDESEADIDTRVSLAEAFLDVGDRESFEMIEAELREEGAHAALERLDELKLRHET